MKINNREVNVIWGKKGLLRAFMWVIGMLKEERMVLYNKSVAACQEWDKLDKGIKTIEKIFDDRLREYTDYYEGGDVE